MGEIKSTLEIALEKAKAVEISKEERERFKREEVLAKARDIFSRFKNHPSRTTRLVQEIKRSGEDARLLKACLTEIFLEALDDAHSSERIWQGLQELGLKDRVPFKESLSQIAEDEKRARREEIGKVENTLRESLAKRGISGTAVDPNIEENAHWKDFLTNLDQRVSEDLKMLRQRIFRAIEAGSSSPR
jgi:hypothetical protein